MLPEFDHQKASDWQKIMAIDPYMLRHEALSRPIQPMEIGRILYHLSKHRGYWSSRVDTPRTEEEEKDLGKVKQGISDLTSAMENQTLGSYLAQLPTGTQNVAVTLAGTWSRTSMSKSGRRKQVIIRTY